MKRTFLVEIEHTDDRPAEELDVILTLNQEFGCVSVTDITATHAKEREVIEAMTEYDNAMQAYDANESICDDFMMAALVSESRESMIEKFSELRALMEKKS